MKRRNFLTLSVLAATAAVLVPFNLKAEDYRKTKPETWKAHTVEDAIEKLYGTKTTIKEGVMLTIPSVAPNGGAIPVDFSSEIPAKSVAVFQNANPESAVCVMSLNENSIIDFSIKMKMKKDGVITIIVEGLDGKLYEISKSIQVALGGCDT